VRPFEDLGGGTAALALLAAGGRRGTACSIRASAARNGSRRGRGVIGRRR
jgi:hypothetical protein